MNINDKDKQEKFLGVNNLLIKSVNIIDPLTCKEFISDIFIENGIVKSIEKDIKVDNLTDWNEFFKETRLKFLNNLLIFNASGYHACPGFFDMHVHLREPGGEDEEDLESGAKAALRGGITSVVCMPNTNPPLDKDFLIKSIITKASKLNFNIYPAAAMTKGLEGLEMTEIGILKESGAVALSDDGRCVQDARLMYEIMKYSTIFDIPLILHEEDYSFSSSGVANEGYYSSALGLNGISELSEILMVLRDIMLARKSKAKIHITHVSTKTSVEIIRKAKEEGVNVTCDVTPHHLYFDESFIKDFNTNFKVNPPLRTNEDRLALIDAVKDGVIDAIASDHAPHLEAEKSTTFIKAAYGVIGLETLFKATYTLLCKENTFNRTKLIRLLTISPAKILGLNTTEIKRGLRAYITVLDLDREAIIKKEDFYSKSSNCAFIGKKLASDVLITINNGKICFVNDMLG